MVNEMEDLRLRKEVKSLQKKLDNFEELVQNICTSIEDVKKELYEMKRRDEDGK